ncbi:MAG TPA: FAD:protein FMN transferase [Acidimicrobiales bacterium]|nr:FAD:protein FMN transferase [Acidimicrobiales bacterium]
MPQSAECLDDEVVATTRAMATEIHLRAASIRVSRAQLDDAISSAIEVFHNVERVCTRFDSSSDLMRVNGSPQRWHQVPASLFAAVQEASRAHQRTAGRFDPRVLATLVSLGYDRTLDFGSATPVARGGATPSWRRQPWRPRFRGGSHEILVGEPLDLGGIGKGLAVRWASQRLAEASTDYLVEAGGDCYCAGVAPDGDRWRVGVEDPTGGDEPVAVLALSNRAVTTSSIRLRRWTAGSAPVHHLIDPRTGRPGGEGLLAVSVVGSDPARAEVMSKALFLEGRTKIAVVARRHGVAALWIDEDATMTTSPEMQRYIRWQRWQR